MLFVRVLITKRPMYLGSATIKVKDAISTSIMVSKSLKNLHWNVVDAE